MTIANRLDEAMKAAGFLSQSALSRASGVPQPTINRILKGGGKRGPETETLRKLAQTCNVSFDWLNENIGQKPRVVSQASNVVALHDDDERPDAVRIRKVTLKLSAGIEGFIADPEPEDAAPIFFRHDWLTTRGLKPEYLIVIGVKGGSMEPNLHEGDSVTINTADRTPKDGDVFAVNYEGEAVIKRMVRDGGTWWLSSDNPDQRRYPRKECSGDACIVIGKVIHKQSERI